MLLETFSHSFSFFFRLKELEARHKSELEDALKAQTEYMDQVIQLTADLEVSQNFHRSNKVFL